MMTTDRDIAHVLWRAADRLRQEAIRLRQDATRIEEQAAATDELARRFADNEVRS